EAAHAEPVRLEPGEGAAAGDLLDLRAHALEVVLPYRLRHRVNRLGEWLPPRKRVALGLGEERDFVPLEPACGEPDVEHVAVDLPAGSNDAARRHVEPRGPPPDLELLAVGQPEPALPERVVEHDAHILELRVEIRVGGEVEGEADQIRGRRIHVQHPYDARRAGAFQYTSSSSWSALMRRGGSASPSPSWPRKNRKPWAWAL